ncbi:hypothetical protein BJX63DRAFT_435940 [Aspergillus granulosus]|uniref:Uncharacterized protein n=1 Tax=Aspergillus granulosus TaxID=176169 RepID=A0ABR4GZM6_9EURO
MDNDREFTEADIPQLSYELEQWGLRHIRHLHSLRDDVSKCRERASLLENELAQSSERARLLETELAKSRERICILENELARSSERFCILKNKLAKSSERACLLDAWPPGDEPLKAIKRANARTDHPEDQVQPFTERARDSGSEITQQVQDTNNSTRKLEPHVTIERQIGDALVQIDHINSFIDKALETQENRCLLHNQTHGRFAKQLVEKPDGQPDQTKPMKQRSTRVTKGKITANGRVLRKRARVNYCL